MGAVRPDVVDSLHIRIDPEVPFNIVDTDLTYGVDAADNGDLSITMTMTTHSCPLYDTLISDVMRYAEMPGVNDVKVDVVWGPPWAAGKISGEAHRTLDKMCASMSGLSGTPTLINYNTATPQVVGKLVKQEDDSTVLTNEHDRESMMNQVIVSFRKLCNGQWRITELVGRFARQTGMQCRQVEKKVLQLVNHLCNRRLLIMPDTRSNVTSARHVVTGRCHNSPSEYAERKVLAQVVKM